jgi:hypothetical protein
MPELQEATESPDLETLIAEAPPAPEIPEITATPDAAPITADAVSSDKEEAPTLPDSSIISGKLDALFGVETEPEPEPTPQKESEPELSARDQILALRKLLGQPVEADVHEAESDSEIDIIRKEMKELKRAHDQMLSEAQQRKQHAELLEAQQEVSRFITDNEEHFPLINALGQPELVFQRMYAQRQSSGRTEGESVAARETEAELERAGHILAAKLGYVKPGDVESSGEEQVSVSSAMSIDVPLDVEEMSDEEHLEYIIAQSK